MKNVGGYMQEVTSVSTFNARAVVRNWRNWPILYSYYPTLTMENIVIALHFPEKI